MSWHQISANNSTPLHYSKKTRYSPIIRVPISIRNGGYNSTRVIFESELKNSVFIIWYSSEFEPGCYLCFDWTRFWVFDIELRLDLGYILLRFDSRTNLESVPRFAEICFSFFTWTIRIKYWVTRRSSFQGHIRAPAKDRCSSSGSRATGISSANGAARPARCAPPPSALSETLHGDWFQGVGAPPRVLWGLWGVGQKNWQHKTTLLNKK